MIAKQVLYLRRFASSQARQIPWRTVRIPRRDIMASQKSCYTKNKQRKVLY